jgi:hypothetical protein
MLVACNRIFVRPAAIEGQFLVIRTFLSNVDLLIQYLPHKIYHFWEQFFKMSCKVNIF